MSKLFKRTKILATVGPSVFPEDKLKEMVYAGVNGFRMNFSHGANEEKDEQIAIIRKYAAERGKAVAILQDLQGPKIRLGALKDNHLDLKAGDEVVLDYALQEHDGTLFLPVQYNLAEKVKVGEPISMFDGQVHAEVVEIVSDTAIKVKVENDGFLMSKKGINLPDTDLGGDILTEKDMADIEFGASRDFDFVAMSFVQSAEDIEKLRQILVSHGSKAQIVAKIETKKAIETDEVMEAIVRATDGIMIARGDMAIEAGAEVVPIVQRKLIALCRQHCKLVIVATQMMSSMVESPEPTRAEVSDVATAVILGTDAVMLSDETANGKYPIETIKEMKKVILYTQNHSRILPIEKNPTGEYKSYDALGKAAVKLAEQIEADMIIASTMSGATAASVAAQRPNLPIVSVTSDARVANQLALTYSNSAYVRDFSATYAQDLAHELKDSGYLKPKEGKDDLTIVFLSGVHRNDVGGTDTIQIRKI
ncbi:pyruvate kinase [Candidatus Saccharibacteria bacterium]|nr:pyruvate kinase [Candidatus Saccharibacteria bacterium]